MELYEFNITYNDVSKKLSPAVAENLEFPQNNNNIRFSWFAPSVHRLALRITTVYGEWNKIVVYRRTTIDYNTAI